MSFKTVFLILIVSVLSLSCRDSEDKKQINTELEKLNSAYEKWNSSNSKCESIKKELESLEVVPVSGKNGEELSVLKNKSDLKNIAQISKNIPVPDTTYDQIIQQSLQLKHVNTKKVLNDMVYIDRHTCSPITSFRILKLFANSAFHYKPSNLEDLKKQLKTQLKNKIENDYSLISLYTTLSILDSHDFGIDKARIKSTFKEAKALNKRISSEGMSLTSTLKKLELVDVSNTNDPSESRLKQTDELAHEEIVAFNNLFKKEIAETKKIRAKVLKAFE
jgi:hypothetical protein